MGPVWAPGVVAPRFSVWSLTDPLLLARVPEPFPAVRPAPALCGLGGCARAGPRWLPGWGRGFGFLSRAGLGAWVVDYVGFPEVVLEAWARGVPGWLRPP